MSTTTLSARLGLSSVLNQCSVVTYLRIIRVRNTDFYRVSPYHPPLFTHLFSPTNFHPLIFTHVGGGWVKTAKLTRGRKTLRLLRTVGEIGKFTQVGKTSESSFCHVLLCVFSCSVLSPLLHLHIFPPPPPSPQRTSRARARARMLT